MNLTLPLPILNMEMMVMIIKFYNVKGHAGLNDLDPDSDPDSDLVLDLDLDPGLNLSIVF